MESLDGQTVAVAIGLLTTMVIGATELVKSLFDRNYRAAVTIAVAALVGGLAGELLFEQIGLALGIVSGLSASGIITGVQKIGTGTTVTSRVYKDASRS